MASSLLSLPTEDRILLYLSDFRDMDSVYEAPPDITQKEIAIEVGIQRKHISRYLKKLMSEELVDEKMCHVQGAKQRMKCYALSWVGRGRARDIREYVGNKKINILIDGNIREMLVSEIDGATSVHLTLSDIVSEAMDSKECIDMARLERIEERKRRIVDERTRKAEVYRQALAVAWRSGVLTSSEKHLIDALKVHLGVTEEEHRSMENQIINNIDPIRKIQAELYNDILTIVGDEPTENEGRILALLREKLDIR